ncbi:MAG TPA: hypothetical protein VF395_08535 [Polyangiaceae bacterium]
MTTARDRAFWALVGLGAVVCALFAWELWSGAEFSVDDAYITFSFSKNLARGAGPVYGQSLRVEGYSNFLWMALVALPLVFAPSRDPMALAHGVEVPFVFLLFAATYVLARTRASRVTSFTATLLVAANLDVLLAFRSGLETLPYMALVTAGFAAYLRRDTSPRARRLVIPIFTAISLMRIDGFIPFGFVILLEAATQWGEKRLSLLALARWAGPGVAVWGAWFAWRFSYYGFPLPSTYYAKELIPTLMPRRGMEYVVDELACDGLYLALPAFGYLLWRRHRPALIVGLFALLQLVYTIRVGGDWMPDARFVLPAVPILVVLVAWAADELLARAREYGRFATIGAGAMAIGAALFIGDHVEPHLTQAPRQRAKLALAVDQTRHVEHLKKAASFLRFVVPRDGRLVTDYGGVLAYYTNATPIEMWGLCNITIARRGNTERVLPVYGRTCPECYRELDPDFFHVTSPLVRGRYTFAQHSDVVHTVWQTDTIGRYLDFSKDFVSGRVVNLKNGEALWFLQRVRPGWEPRPRLPAPGVAVEYPFSPGGRIAG